MNKTVDMIALWLLIIGGLNWGLVSLGWNLVEMIFGAWPMLVTLVYALVGLSAIYVAWMSLSKKSAM